MLLECIVQTISPRVRPYPHLSLGKTTLPPLSQMGPTVTQPPHRKSRSGSRGRSRTRTKGKDGEHRKSRRLLKNSKLPIPVPPEGRKVVPWPRWLRVQFENVPLSSTESCWYGPWPGATLLSTLFPPSFQMSNGETGHFQLAPQHIRLNDSARRSTHCSTSS